MAKFWTHLCEFVLITQYYSSDCNCHPNTYFILGSKFDEISVIAGNICVIAGNICVKCHLRNI